MHKLRFLLSRRWIVFALVVVALAWVAWRLGEWQFHRLEDRQERNEIIQRNEESGPAPVAEVLAPGRDVALADEWRIVEATGTYAVEDTVIVRYRTREGAAGVDVVVPLELADGTSLLVDRGWYATDNRGATTADVPAPPAGEVTVTGWVRRDAEGDSTEVADRSTRAVDSRRIGEALGREVLGGWVDLRSESPEPETPLVPVELPELDEGPHFFYGLQWWFFGALAIFGFFYLIYDEWRGGRGPWGNNQAQTPERTAPGRVEPARARRRTLRERLDSGAEPGDEPGDRSVGAEETAVDREHHARQE
ncbi:SURF1 family cytochrome oxidase biogenesis protein [Nocardioides ganghwensis]|uniref:SURF1-like protein n=1 Tax=Nocardioides ganghwensis TaxID=252230 RepID=A0A4Q2SGB4_9ACTN|nr:SURF1 family protein [Nocardioides ganghwensis]MBD3946663.1 SURF1 family protein [Nocardioides ganghwensis]RYC02979.1 SURF1 family protein [Nocardioides ganghwensis]